MAYAVGNTVRYKRWESWERSATQEIHQNRFRYTGLNLPTHMGDLTAHTTTLNHILLISVGRSRSLSYGFSEVHEMGTVLRANSKK